MPRLLLRDTVDLRTGGGRDANDAPIPVVLVPVRAEVVPVSGDQQAARGRNMTTTTFRLVCRDDRVGAVTTVVWRGTTYTLEGKAMPYRIGGRTHHWEVLMSVGTG